MEQVNATHTGYSLEQQQEIKAKAKRYSAFSPPECLTLFQIYSRTLVMRENEQNQD